MTLYYGILKGFLKYDLHNRYKDLLDGEFVKENHPELFKLFQCLALLHEKQAGQEYTLTDLEIALETYYPNTDRSDYSVVFSKLEETSITDSVLTSYLEQARARQVASHLANKALAVAEGRETWASFKEAMESAAQNVVLSESETQLTDFVEDNLETLLTSQFDVPGLRWRLKSLNEALGSLRKGDFGFLFARPETGKTTFLASEVTFMASQATGPIIWFNNEEQGSKVVLRCYQAALGLELMALEADRLGNKQKYTELTGNRIKLLADASITKKRVEEICRHYQPSLIIFDQIDKIKGFQADRNDLELKEIYVWARELAKLYCPVIGVCQAGGSGDGKRWLTMNDVDNSKTGKQGEADWILGIGKDYDEGHEYVRYFNLSKNKLLGDHDTDPRRRHDHWETRILPEIGRYADF